MARTGSKRRGKPRSGFGRIFGWIVRIILIFVVGSILWVLAYRFVPPPFTLTMAGDLLGGRSVTKDWTPLERIDRDMVRAAIAAEDSKFCSHGGFDTDAIADAMRRNAEGGRIRGGSTISQQTAKNAFLWQGGGYFRKGLEAWFTLLIEQMWGKRRIMEVYLNIAETGIATYGVEAGAQRYFGKGAGTLSRNEAARIAAILPLPKKREAIAPSGFTRRYGNSIAARIGVVARDGLDSCVYAGGETAPPDRPEKAVKAPDRKAAPKAEPREERPEDYIDAPDIGAPVAVEAPPVAIEAAPAPSAEEPAPALNGL
ncbi:monofunctional biosynthetic peptidoglycan transglycosylase [Allosphingosinicella indica]|uniref:Biosynthetic peptidoglycan transglycosylase n=1 Tax=Allosphingosinicella indica TaxID=941907 RepID=A0A1X7FXJ7_9SPHN|nr:monofunctional biosynthetic peptidoglycan transglycosylase [Allosphingosinicella indica]